MRATFDPYSGAPQLLFAFEAAVIGGAGSLWGTLVGGIVLGVAQALGNHVDVRYDLLSGVLFGHLLFLAVLAFRPQGLFGRKGRA
jgi:branched-chain amino acid transport system permease protein